MNIDRSIIKEKLEEAKRLVEQALSMLASEEDSKSALSENEEFSILLALLNSQEWPNAVPDIQIADENSEKDKNERAEGIVEILLPSLKGKTFLDFGCGEGHVANYVSEFCLNSVGYDILRSDKSKFDWEQNDGNFLLTTDFEKVKSNGPYEIILIYDVLDHAHISSPQEILMMAKSVLADEGKIYLRTHPWTSRHGGHAYRKTNKAFVHLIFTEDELKSMGVELDHNLKIMAPLATYDSWVEDSGLKKVAESEADLQDIEPFFKDNPVVRKRILNAFSVNEWGDKPEWQMKQCFWDYVLDKS